MFKRFYEDASGSTAIEYGPVAGLIAVAVIASLNRIGFKLWLEFTILAWYLDPS